MNLLIVSGGSFCQCHDDWTDLASGILSILMLWQSCDDRKLQTRKTFKRSYTHKQLLLREREKVWVVERERISFFSLNMRITWRSRRHYLLHLVTAGKEWQECLVWFGVLIVSLPISYRCHSSNSSERTTRPFLTSFVAMRIQLGIKANHHLYIIHSPEVTLAKYGFNTRELLIVS